MHMITRKSFIHIGEEGNGWGRSLTPSSPSDISISLPVGNRMEGKTVSIINRSEIVGRPLGALLANDGKKCHIFQSFSMLPNQSIKFGKKGLIIAVYSIHLPSPAMLCYTHMYTGADIFSVDIDSIFNFRRGQLLKTEETPESAVRKSDVIVCGK